MNDSQSRSLAKAFSWRVLATLTTGVIVFVTTGEWKLAFAVGAIEVMAKFLLYYLHERAWQHIRFGLK